MKDYVKRMIDERADLSAKIERAEKFLNSKPDISAISLFSLHWQVSAMKNYLYVLDFRICCEDDND